MDGYNFPACLSDIPGYLEILLYGVDDIEEKRREFEAAKPIITRMVKGDLLPNKANGRSVTIEGALEAVGEYLDKGDRNSLEKARNVLEDMRSAPALWNF